MADPREEALAALAHEQWSGWMEYLFDKCEGSYEDGSLTIPEEYVTRWKRQINTSYAELPEEEKESDRIEARKVLALLKGERCK